MSFLRLITSIAKYFFKVVEGDMELKKKRRRAEEEGGEEERGKGAN